MQISKFGFFGLALGGMLLLGSGARAETVTYVATGSFSGGDLAGSSTYLDSAAGVQIDFLPALDNEVSVPPASQTSFGTFDTSLTTTTDFASVDSGFTLTIFQTGPTAGELDFVGSLDGRIKINNSQAFVLFDQPLVGTIGLVVYSIVNADDMTPGRVNIAPPTTNDGRTTVVGRVNLIPEPSAVILMGMGAVAPLALMVRSRRKGRAAA